MRRGEIFKFFKFLEGLRFPLGTRPVSTGAPPGTVLKLRSRYFTLSVEDEGIDHGLRLTRSLAPLTSRLVLERNSGKISTFKEEDRNSTDPKRKSPVILT